MKIEIKFKPRMYIAYYIIKILKPFRKELANILFERIDKDSTKYFEVRAVNDECD